MRKRKWIVYFVALAMFMTSLCTFSFAADCSVTITKPADNSKYYKGESIPIDIDFVGNGDPSEDAYIVLYSGVGDNMQSVLLDEQHNEVVGTYHYQKSFSTNSTSNGKYTLWGRLSPDLNVSSFDAADEVVITIATLKAPTNLKAKAGKKKVTITYKKADGATSYEIYRSTKKSKGYKKVATTNKLKYVDKKVKKGKKYYYKVRSKRDKGNGVVYSSYRGPVKTKKVKK